MVRPHRDSGTPKVPGSTRISAALLGGLVFIALFEFAAALGCQFPPGGTARVIRIAAMQGFLTKRTSACPKYPELVKAELFHPSFLIEVTGKDVQIDCVPSDVLVRWAGPDHQFDTTDDETSPNPVADLGVVTLAKLGLAAVVVVAGAVLATTSALLAATLNVSSRGWLARLASSVGWLAVVMCVGAGFRDMTMAHIAAARPRFFRTDAARLRAAGNHSFFAEAMFGILVGAPGIALWPLPLRRSRARRARTAGLT